MLIVINIVCIVNISNFIFRIPNAKAGRDMFDISIYGMDGVPIELINIRLNDKVEIRKRKLDKESKLFEEEKDEDGGLDAKKRRKKKNKEREKKELDMKYINIK